MKYRSTITAVAGISGVAFLLFLSAATFAQRKEFPSRVTLPANAAGFALFDMRGAKVWQFTRATSGEMGVDVPRRMSSRGIAVVKYFRN